MSTIATLTAILGVDIGGFQSGMRQASGSLTNMANDVQEFARNMMITMGGISAAGMVAQFDESMTNIQAVTKASGSEMQALQSQLLEMGKDSIAGPQAVADAYYDIAGGVTDATKRMPTLQAALAAAEAGNASLTATTQGLVSVMNSYASSNLDAMEAADIFTATVGVGVGNMDQFVAAMSPVAGLAASAGISFKEMGAAAAFMTTKGATASQAMTRFQAIITAMMKPNEEMKRAIRAAGYASGTAMIQTLGLAGATEALSKAVGGSQDKMAAALGTTEALNGAIVLGTEEFKDFRTSFEDNVVGATEQAQQIQLTSLTAEFAKLKNWVAATALEVLTKLKPAISWLITGVMNAISWLNRFSPSFLPVIAAATAMVAAIGPLSMALNILLGPIGLIAAALGGLAIAWDQNFMGIRDIVMPVIERIQAGMSFLLHGIGIFIEDVRKFNLGEAIRMAFGLGEADGASWVQTMLVRFGMSKENAAKLVADAQKFIDETVPQISAVLNGALAGIQSFYDSNLKPVIDRIINGIGGFIQSFQGADWSGVATVLAILGAAVGFLGVVIASVATSLVQTLPEFGKALRSIVDALALAAQGDLIGALSKLKDAIVGFGGALLQIPMNAAQTLLDILGIKIDVAAGLASWKTLFEQQIPAAMSAAFGEGGPIQNAIKPLIDFWNSLFGDGEGSLKSKVAEGMRLVQQKFEEIFGEAGVVQDAIGKGIVWVQELIDKFNDIKDGLARAFQNVLGIITKPFRDALKWLGEQLVKVGDIGGPFSGLRDIGYNLIATAGNGYAQGGYTGNGPTDEIAGVVHGQEYVVPKGGALVVRDGGANKPADSSGGVVNVSIVVNGQTDAASLVNQIEAELRRRNKSLAVSYA